MTRPPNRLRENIDVERITPRKAITLLIHGLLPPDDADEFRPANLSVTTIIQMLHRANEVRNRTVSLPVVEKYARDMTEGNWLWTGVPIQLDPDGYVRNGQHRLLAVVLSGTTQDFVVVRNVDPAAQLVTDVGRTRTAANQMQLAGVSNAPITTAIANQLLRWRAGKAMQSSYIPSIIEVNALITSDAALIDAVAYVHRLRYAVKHMPQAAFGAAFVEATYVDVDARDLFFNSFLSGAELPVDSPILVLRNKLTLAVSRDLRVHRTAGKLYLIVHAWNLWRKGESSRMLRVPRTLTSETFPKMH